MYGLPQAGRIANDALKPHLAKYGYEEMQHTHGLFKHKTRPIMSCLVVDDFGVQYEGDGHAEHLLHCLRDKYTITTDRTGSAFIGLTIDWDYANGTVDISMPGHIERALQRLHHPTPSKPRHAPYPFVPPDYGAKIQLTPEPDETKAIDAGQRLRLQQVIGVSLHYARAVDNTMLPALGSLAAAQNQGTQATMANLTWLLNYSATHPDAVVRCHSSDMTLHDHSDASCLSEPMARSRVGGFLFLSNNIDDTTRQPPINGAVHVISDIMANVMSSAAEAEVGGLCIDSQEACPIRVALEEMGCTQPPTTTTTDNQCAEGIANDTVKQRRSKAMDMRFYWVRDRTNQGQSRVLWHPGVLNLADYFTKHHSATHHRDMRPRYLYVHPQQSPQ